MTQGPLTLTRVQTDGYGRKCKKGTEVVYGNFLEPVDEEFTPGHYWTDVRECLRASTVAQCASYVRTLLYSGAMVVHAGTEAIVPVTRIVGVRTRADGAKVARPTLVEKVPQDEWPADLFDDEFTVTREVEGRQTQVMPEVTALPSLEFDRLLEEVRAERAESA